MPISRTSSRVPRTRSSATGWRRVRIRASSILAAAVWAAAALTDSACTATNFLDPEGPRYYESARSSSPPAAAGEPDGAIRVISFNIEFGREIEGAIRLIRTTGSLGNPDLLLLQEMSGAGVVRMARELGLNYLYFPSGIHPQAHQEYGTAILSPWRIDEPSKLMLPHGAAVTGMRRAVTVATVRWRDHPIRVYSVHLPAPLAIAKAQRREQVRLILEAAGRDPGPVIVAGDFNSRDVGPWFEQAGFTWVTHALSGTVRRFGRRFSLDHVFVRGLAPHGDAPPAGCVEATGVSDHCAVWARLIKPG